jgi:hypothetical protein
MLNAAKALGALALCAMLMACNPNYEHQRPDMDAVTPGDAGLQSKDLLSCTEQMVRSLLANKDLRTSQTQWTLVVDRVEDKTMDHSFSNNYDIFTERLRVCIGKYGNGQVTVVENKAKLGNLRSKELDGAPDMGQGGGAGVNRIQPQFALYAKAFDMPNRATNTYMLSFIVTDMRDGRQVWMDEYTVKTGR